MTGQTIVAKMIQRAQKSQVGVDEALALESVQQGCSDMWGCHVGANWGQIWAEGEMMVPQWKQERDQGWEHCIRSI